MGGEMIEQAAISPQLRLHCLAVDPDSDECIGSRIVTLMRVPGTPGALGLLLRSRAFLRSPMGFGGCFADLGLIDGEFRQHVVEPLVRSARRRDGVRAT